MTKRIIISYTIIFGVLSLLPTIVITSLASPLTCAVIGPVPYGFVYPCVNSRLSLFSFMLNYKVVENYSYFLPMLITNMVISAVGAVGISYILKRKLTKPRLSLK